ncbi:MAG: hypothetical protein Q9220_003323 [cf. Caloplaca sp. 1 TL-2023]
MANAIPLPAPYTLLPPLLACLPTAFASTRPPPALLPLLSPILRQRVQLLSDSASSPSNTWLTKLSWDPSKAEQLPSIVEGEAFELHPISNEIEFGEEEILGYRRLDEETLQARIDIRDLGLTVIYLWCRNDAEGGGDGWRVAELMPLDNREDAPSIWLKSIEEADQKCVQQNSSGIAVRSTNGISVKPLNGDQGDIAVDGAEDDDDDYWAQYDNIPTSTPGPQSSPGPQAPSSGSRHGRTLSDAEHYSRYTEVQPDMDNDDPLADRNAIGESSLNGDTLTSTATADPLLSNPVPPLLTGVHESNKDIFAPQPSHTAIDGSQILEGSDRSSSPIVDKLEGSAMLQSQTELAVRQHVASTMKSLHRLARSTGMEMDEFEKMIGNELEVLKFEEAVEEG